MEIRRARPDDAAAVAEVHVRTWQAAYEHVFGADRLAAIDGARRAAQWRQWLRQGELVLVAETDGRVVAFSWVGPSRDAAGEAELFAIYALPEAWGGGAGPALMRASLEQLRDAGYGEAILWVLTDNPRARRFYEREGWRDDGGRKQDTILGAAVEEARFRISL